jgi:hypothetical protein
VLIKRPTYDNTVIYYGQRYAHQYDMDETYGGFMLAFEYQRSFDSSKLARGMFGSNVLNFAGSAVSSPAPLALLADNFGLSQNFQGSIALRPIIQDYNLHFDGFIGFDRWLKGLYLQIDMNFDYQTRQLQTDCACTINNTSTAVFPAGYMSNSTAQATPVGDIQTALALQSTFGDKTGPTTFGRFDFCTRTEAGLAGLAVNLGYDFVRCDNYFLGAFFRVVAPTGSKVKPCFVFDALVGNGKGWELGGGISSRWELWNNNDCQKLTAMLDGYVVSVLKHDSLRTFDLASTNTALRANYDCNGCSTSCNNSCNNSCAANSCATSCNTGCSVDSCADSCAISACSTGCNSSSSCNSGCNNCNAANCLTRYQLLKQFSVSGGTYTYASNLITAADFTTRSVDVSTAVKGDATLRLVYTHGGFDFGIGYNIFGMSREKISSVSAPSSCLITSTGTVYGVKGCQCVSYNQYELTVDGLIDCPDGAPVVMSAPLVSTASNSSAYNNGCGNGCGSIDNPLLIDTTTSIDGTRFFNVACNNTAPITCSTNFNRIVANPAYVEPTDSNPPVVLVGDPNELDLCSGTAPRQLTNKGFISLDYTWQDHAWSPYIGFIAEIEGGSRNTDVAQWGIVIRGGASY